MARAEDRWQYARVVPEISKTADLGLAILVTLREQGPLTAPELARALSLNRTVLHRMLTTLRLRSFVIREANTYALGPAIVRLAEGVQPRLRVAALAAMTALSRATGETVVLHIAEDDDAVVLHQVLGTAHIVRVEHQIGLRHPVTQGASGRAILSYLDSELIERVVPEGEQGESLRRQIEEVRRLGYAVSHDELQLGVAGIAAPVIDPDGVSVGSIALLVPSGRAGTLAAHTGALLEAGREASAALARADGRASDVPMHPANG
jgi:IclR family KDG regulon transcriptional repressor